MTKRSKKEDQQEDGVNDEEDEKEWMTRERQKRHELEDEPDGPRKRM